jgi:hypothetical protein
MMIKGQYPLNEIDRSFKSCNYFGLENMNRQQNLCPL